VIPLLSGFLPFRFPLVADVLKYARSHAPRKR
jgi:hypothetical protein